MPWITDLQETVLAIAISDAGRLRVMAGPGTGKSFAIQRKAARLLEEGLNPRRILAVTFTRNAASNLVHDLKDLEIPGCERIRTGTLHAFCFSLLLKENVLQFLERVPRTLITFNQSGVLQFEAQPLIEDIQNTGEFGDKRKCTKRIRAFEAAWARLQHEEPGWPTEPSDIHFHQELLEWLRFHRAMLIGELVPEALRFLRSNPASPEKTTFDEVIVDEYQDLNKAEQILLDLLSTNARLSVVGDIDQSIYSFRFANPEGIIEFSNRHPETQDEILLSCRRCPRKVVAVADYLIRQNHPASYDCRLNICQENPEGEIYTVQWDSLVQERNGLGQFVQDLVTNRGYEYKDILILSPRRLLGYGIRDTLRSLDIPTHSFFHEEALESTEAQRAFALLTLLAHPDDRVALRFWLGEGSSNWRAGEYSRLHGHCEATGNSPRSVLDLMKAGQLRISFTNRILDKYVELRETLNDIEQLRSDELIDRLFPETSEWARPLREIAMQGLEENGTPSDLLDELKIQITQPEMPEEGGFVKVMSLHKSKGLTSKVVILVGCNQGLIPTLDSNHTPAEARANLQEQRRLFYVSITRCKEILVLSSVTHLPGDIVHRIGARVIGRGTLCRTYPSQFLNELGPATPAPMRGREWVERGFF